MIALGARLGLLCCAALAGVVPAGGQQSAVPADLQIVLASAPRPAGDGAASESVEISASGAVSYSRKEVEGGVLPPQQAVLPAAAVAAIWDVIERQRFFELDEVYVDPDVSGGDMAVLEIIANGTGRTVMTVNIGVDAFDAIVWAINDQLPDDRQVIYNALHIEGYKRVAR